jgi:hypothetical protein
MSEPGGGRLLRLSIEYLSTQYIAIMPKADMNAIIGCNDK